MEQLQISLNNIARLCHFASLGKLLDGLIHNLNSPLHSLGMQMDVMQHFILKEGESEREVLEKVLNRLSKMNSEFENLNNQIRITGIRANFLDFPPEKLDINHFVHQELEFLRANLYFKHNVETTLQLSPSLPPITPSPKYFNLAMGLFFERLVEELERLECKKLLIGTTSENKSNVLFIAVENTEISEGFSKVLNLKPDTGLFFQDAGQEMNLSLSVFLLMNCGVVFTTELEGRSTVFRLSLSTHDNGL